MVLITSRPEYQGVLDAGARRPDDSAFIGRFGHHGAAGVKLLGPDL